MNIPVSVCWNITSDCNLECPFCFRDKGSNAMPPCCWEVVIDKLSLAGVRRLALAGGEPFTVPGISGLLTKAKDSGLSTAVITNGTLLDPKAIDDLALSLDEIAISIDGATAESHALIRRTDMRDFSHLFKCLRALAQTTIRRRVNSVVTAQSTKSLDDLGELLCTLGVHEWRLMQFYPLHEVTGNAHKYQIADTEFARIVSRIQRRYDGTPISISVGSNESMTKSYFNIAPDGAVYTSAPSRKLLLGHILEDSIEDMAKRQGVDWRNHLKQYSIVE